MRILTNLQDELKKTNNSDETIKSQINTLQPELKDISIVDVERVQGILTKLKVCTDELNKNNQTIKKKLETAQNALKAQQKKNEEIANRAYVNMIKIEAKANRAKNKLVRILDEANIISAEGTEIDTFRIYVKDSSENRKVFASAW
eukprot:CAMPEP_0114502670 /NCGR_PEP_ID=MMETSP0109-20121206/9225_1 /TAXON_ID=29199 /ORGANISM="Chlorarachnion reptans, Strain CCCM449" /LENGTH=145 /DNA_ID=CAMNT_0001680621 /DNA_START=550 /DNA_END=984 /DNA_ORIENTATION=-